MKIVLQNGMQNNGTNETNVFFNFHVKVLVKAKSTILDKILTYYELHSREEWSKID